jgi:hypothetical protein
MKRILIASAVAAALATPALAQSTTVTTTGPAASATITLAPEQRTRIKTYVTEKKVKPVVIKEQITVGATLPADVELVEVPSDWGTELAQYRFVHWDNRVVLVEPASRRVVQIID